MLYDNTIVLTVSGLSSDFYWNMSDVNHTQQEGLHGGGALLGMIDTFLMLSFQPTPIQIGETFTTKYFESQKSKLVQKTITQNHERKVHQKLLITMTQMKPLTHDPRIADFIVSRRIQLGKGHLHLDLVLHFLKAYAMGNLPEIDTGN